MTDPTPGGRGPVAFFAGNPIAGNLLMIFLIAGGLYTASRLEIVMVPEQDTRRVTVAVPYPGSTAAEVEEDINRRIEEGLIPVRGIDRVTSRALDGLGSVTVELGVIADSDEIRDDVRSVVESIEMFPPAAAEEPQIELVRVAGNVLTVAVTSAVYPEAELRNRAEQVREDLLALPTVTRVSPFATRDREISIEVSEEALRTHGLTIGEVANAVRQASVNLSSGELHTEIGGLVLRTRARRSRGEDFADIVLLSREDGTLLSLADVAEVRDEFADVDVAADIDGRPAVLLRVNRNEGQRPLDVANEVKEFLAGYRAPPGVDVFVWDDNTRNLTGRINVLLASGFMGFALVFVFLALVFDFRVATWVAVGVPTSFLGACLLFPAFGVTISLVSISALILVIGIVVDDAIVVGESIANEHERGGRGAAAAIAGARAVLPPVVVGVATTVLAFAPLLFTTGGIGQQMQVLPVVVGLVLAFSLAEAFFILPSHLSNAAPWSRWPLAELQDRVRRRIEEWRDGIVVPAISAAVRRPFVTLLASALFVAGAGLIVATDTVRYVFLQGLPTDRLQAGVTFPPGTPAHVTEGALERIVRGAREANALAGDDPVRTVAVVVGQQGFSPNPYARDRYVQEATSTGSHLGMVTVHLREEAQRALSPAEFLGLWRAHVGDIPGADSVRFLADELSGEPGVAFAFVHPSDDVLAEAVAEVRVALETDPAVRAVVDSLGLGKRQYDIELTDAGKAAGMTPAFLARQLRARFFGEEVQRVQRGRNEIKVSVRYPRERRHGLRDLRDERIVRPDGVEIPLSTVARVVETRDPSVRTRIDGVPAAEVSAHVDLERSTPARTEARLVRDVFPAVLARHPDLRVVEIGQAREEAQVVATLMYTVPLVLLAIYVLIAVLFRSYGQPFIILAGMPFAFAGAIAGHWLLGYDLLMGSIFGILAVGGVVINDTLVLMDRYNRIRAESDVPAVAAISAAARQRFRAIVLTTATTAVGMLPLLLVKSEVTQNLVPLVVSLVFGLIAASAAILFFVPAVLLVAENARDRRLRWR